MDRSIALLILATAVGEHLRTRGINGRTLPDFRLAVPAIHQRYGATNQAWLWEEATDRQPRPVPPPELGQRVIIASPVSWLDVVPDPAGAVWPDPIQGVMLQMILGRCCSDWRLECPDRAAYHAKIRQFFCELHAQPGAAPGVPPLNATQEAMLETWCLRRWGDHD